MGKGEKMTSTEGSDTVPWYEDGRNVGSQALYYLLERVGIALGDWESLGPYIITHNNASHADIEAYSPTTNAEEIIRGLLRGLIDQMKLYPGDQIDFALGQYSIHRITERTGPNYNLYDIQPRAAPAAATVHEESRKGDSILHII